MAIVRIPSYLSAPDDAVQTEHWRLLTGDATETLLGEEYERFDPGSSLHLACLVQVDQRLVRRVCGLTDGDFVGVVGLWSSSATRLRGAGPLHALEASAAKVEVELALDIPCHLIGGTLSLRIGLVLAAVAHDPAPLLPNRIGSILWESKVPQRVALEGIATRFPTELCEFGRGNSFPPGAAWLLDWDSHDLTMPVLGSVRLYINSLHPLAGALSMAATDPGTSAAREALSYDIARQLVTGALENDNFVRGSEEYEAGSLGEVLRRLCTRVLFPYQSVPSLAKLAEAEPGRFAADLQASLRLFTTEGA